MLPNQLASQLPLEWGVLTEVQLQVGVSDLILRDTRIGQSDAGRAVSQDLLKELQSSGPVWCVHEDVI